MNIAVAMTYKHLVKSRITQWAPSVGCSIRTDNGLLRCQKWCDRTPRLVCQNDGTFLVDSDETCRPYYRCQNGVQLDTVAGHLLGVVVLLELLVLVSQGKQLLGKILSLACFTV